MPDRDDGWIVIVPTAPPAEAEAAFAAWRRAHPAIAVAMRPEDFRIDRMRTQDGDRVRVRARLPR